ncbi:MAG: metallophosphoesterase [Nitriliruptoraceae bacterium]
MRRLARATIGCATVAFLWGALIERRLYVCRNVTVAGVLHTPGTLRVLHISDTHLSAGQTHRERFIRQLAAYDYDVVVATGDLLGAVGQEDRCADLLAGLTQHRPGIAVLGSHDLYAAGPIRPWRYFTPTAPREQGKQLDTSRFVAALETAGWTVLRGGTCRINTPAGDVQFGGFDDPHLATTVWPSTATLAASNTTSVNIGVVHAPYKAALDLLDAAGYDLLMAGHTHGGQVRLPVLGALTVNCDLPRRQGRGLSRYGRRWLHVSAGLGHDPSAPYRFACRPEVTLITLRD